MNKEPIMSLRQISFSTPEGTTATLNIPGPVSLELIEVLEQASSLMLRALAGDGPTQRARQAGEAEYASWFGDLAGEAEYASWVVNLRH